MENSRTALSITLFILLIFSIRVEAESDYYYLQEQQDTIKSDSLATGAEADSLKQTLELNFEDADTIRGSMVDSTKILRLPPPLLYKPYFSTYISMRSYGDYFRNVPGIYSLQHGAVGQPEMLTKSVMLPGLSAVYNGFPVFGQGFYIPFRAGLDLNILMYDNVAKFGITPLSNLGLFYQGEELSLESTPWPSDSNLSSVTVAQGAYDYKETAWRFSRLLHENAGVTFTAGFKKSVGFYASGSDYNDFNVLGSFAWKPRPNAEIIYSFYQKKAKQGIVQLDRLIPTTLGSHNSELMHMLKSEYLATENLLLKANLFYQTNYNHIYDDESQNYHLKYKDYIWGAALAANLKSAMHNFDFEIGRRRHFIRIEESAKSLTTGILLGDSLAWDATQSFELRGRLNHNNLEKWKLAITAKFNQALGDKAAASLSAGVLDFEPDIYAMFFTLPTIVPSDQSIIAGYDYQPNPELKAKNDSFAAADFNLSYAQWLKHEIKLTYENVNHDLFPAISGIDSVWSSTQRNINYNRFTLATGLDYSLTKYFTGSSGLAYFYYQPSRPLPQVKYSPVVLAYSRGEFVIREILRDIDLSGAFQFRYLSERDYYGFVSLVTNQYKYKQAVVLDGSLAFRFGSFNFRLTEENILDFLTDNKYTTWGEYSMTPGSIWWQFTWNFRN